MAARKDATSKTKRTRVPEDARAATLADYTQQTLAAMQWATLARLLTVDGKTMRQWVRNNVGHVSRAKSKGDVINAETIARVFDRFYKEPTNA
jgi:hypothetical protein